MTLVTGSGAVGALPRPTGLSMVDFEEWMLPDAARLFTDGVRRLRRGVPALPQRYEDPNEILPLLGRLRSREIPGAQGEPLPAVAALAGGKLVGYLAGFPAPGLRGSGTAAYVPEWSHAATGPDRAETWALMYAAVAARWVELGWLAHLVTGLADDREINDELAWLGFGVCVVDAVRGIAAPGTDRTPSAAGPGTHGATSVEIRPATDSDLDALVALERASEAYYSGPPLFLHRIGEADPRAAMARALTRPGRSAWVAVAGSRVVACLHLGPPGEDVCRVVREPATLAIRGAWTDPACRGSGIGATLVAAVERWAREAGYERISVDFESANLLARPFWLRRFDPVCLSFERHVDDRLAGAGGTR